MIGMTKRRKAAGLDDVHTELFKELDSTNRTALLKIMNEWWIDADKISNDFWQARVVMLHKKGNTSDLNNYRPISLLTSIYKLYAAIIKKRIEQGVETALHKTQYGFRKDRGTADAIHVVRRIIDGIEQTGSKTILLLLDWEKAFDKVNHQALHKTLRRFSLPEVLVKQVMTIYSKPQFIVEVDGQRSKLYNQQTGIRQGCPFSPYLFLLVMTAMFEDIHSEPLIELFTDH